MKKMNRPGQDALLTYDACVSGVPDLGLRQLFADNRGSIQAANNDFEAAGITAAWAMLPRVPRGNPNAIIAGGLTKQNLMKLYTDHMVGTTGAPRDIYDAILSSAGGLCPFCGGLGQAATLDHYLPKANFPAYSVHPSNLVPCCRDCNSGKNSTFGATIADQALHPYLDDLRFFEQQWITAHVHFENPILITFTCSPPVHWSDQDKGRVISHFDGYKLAYRFSVQAGGEVARVVEARAKSLRVLPVESFRGYLSDNANSSDFVLNSWLRSTYRALAASDRFVHTQFHDPNWHLEPALVDV